LIEKDGDLPHARPRPRRIQRRDRGEARRPVHDPQQGEGGETAPGGRLVRAAAFITIGNTELGHRLALTINNSKN
jgi:hypothetical protein